MTIYNVHIYREMRLTFERIEADTPEAAALVAREKQTEDADDIEDCDGEDLAALIDIVGDQGYERSVTIHFETERLRRAAPALLAALEAVLPYAENENRSLYECWKRDDDPALEGASEACAAAVEQAHAAALVAAGESERRPA